MEEIEEIDQQNVCIVCAHSPTAPQPTSLPPTIFFLKYLLKYKLLSNSQLLSLPTLFFCSDCFLEITTAHQIANEIAALEERLDTIRCRLEDQILATLNYSTIQDDSGFTEVRRRVREESTTITPSASHSQKIKQEPPSPFPLDFLTISQSEENPPTPRRLRPRKLPNVAKKSVFPNFYHSTHPQRPQFKCLVCGMTFGRSDYFAVHKSCHSDYPEEELVDVDDFDLDDGEEEDEDFAPPLERNVKKPPKKSAKKTCSCPICSLEFQSYPKMIRHLGSQHETKPEFGCEICDKAFLRLDFLQSHKRRDHGETTTEPDEATDYAQEKLSQRTCPVCFKVFERPSMMTSHHTHVHTPSTDSYICEICAKSFKRRESLKKHVEFHSSGDEGKIFKCESCGKGFRRKRDMEVHQRLHSGVKELLCSLCGISFRHEWSFRRHNILLHGLLPSKKYDCKVCGKVFKIKWHLDQHLKSKSHGGQGLGRRIRKKSTQKKEDKKPPDFPPQNYPWSNWQQNNFQHQHFFTSNNIP